MASYMSRGYNAEWDAANTSNEAPEDTSKGPGPVAEDECWQKGEYPKWRDLERKLLAARQDAVRSSLLSTLEDVIRKAYTPEDGQKVTDEAVKRVARSIMNPLTFYNLLPPAVQVSSDAEKQAVLEQVWQRASTAYKKGQPLEGIPSCEALKLSQHWFKSTCQWTVERNWKPILEYLMQDATHWAYERRMEESDTDRLLEAKKKKVSTPDALANELELDAQDLKDFIPMLKGLRQVRSIDDKKIDRIYGSTPKEISQSVDHVRSGNWITAETAAELINYFNDEERAAIFGRLKNDNEWATDEKNMKYQMGLVESLLKQKDFFGRWLDLVYKQADDLQTEEIRTANQNLTALYKNGRKALAMNLA